MNAATLAPHSVQYARTWLFKNGYKPVPLITGQKHTLVKGWVESARTLTAQQAEAFPIDGMLNTGVLCGNGLIAVDVDTPDAQLSEWIVKTTKQALGNAPIRSRQGTGKCLLVYRSTERHVTSSAVYDKGGKKILESLGEGRQFCAYAIHPEGMAYEWDAQLAATPIDNLTAVTGEQVRDLFAFIAQQVGGKVSRTRQDDAPVTVRSVTVQATPREQQYAQKALAAEIAKLSAMSAGMGRNDALNVAAHNMGTMAGWIELRDVATALLKAAFDNGYVDKDGQMAAMNTINSGLNKGMEKPRPSLSTEPQPATLLPTRKRKVMLMGIGSIQELAIQWHWPGYLPAGMLTLLSGAGGTGKSTLAFNLAAVITTAGVWPDGVRCTAPGNVLIWSSEDSVAHTIKPRLMAAGADMTRIGVIESTTDEQGVKMAFDPARDVDDLRDAIKSIGGVSLLIIDPIVSAVAGDMHKANDVRRSLQPIVDLAAEFDCAVIGITHFAKNTGGRNTTERVIGSQAFAALARMVWATAKEEDSEERVFTRAKSNISADTGGFRYTIQPTTVTGYYGAILPTTRVVWGGTMEGTARSIIGSVEGEEGESKALNLVDEAMRFLHGELKDGPRHARELIDRAKKDFGLNERALQRAREKLGITATKAGFQGAWMWGYPFNPAAVGPNPTALV